MIIDKICYIHVRAMTEQGEKSHNGGATVAWYVSPEGDLIVGKPAVCHFKDKFVKALGRDVAKDNLMVQKPLFTITKEQMQIQAKLQAAVVHNQHAALTPKGRAALVRATLAEIEGNIFEFMASSWFEQLVRNRLAVEGNRLAAKDDPFEGQYEKALEMIEAAVK